MWYFDMAAGADAVLVDISGVTSAELPGVDWATISFVSEYSAGPGLVTVVGT